MAATTTTTILKLQKVECETTVQFQIDDLKACFARGAPTRYSEHFGPGLRFGLWCINDGASASHLGLYLYTSADYPALTVSWTVAGRSPGGASVHPGKTMAYTFRSGEAIGWSRFVTAEQFHASDAMRADNALVLHATLRFAPVWPIVSRPTLDAVHRVVVGRSAPDVRYVAYKRRDANGRLSGRTVLYSSREAMEQGSEELRDLCDAGSKKLSASILKNGEEAKRTAFTDYRDDDSDFEDDAPDTDQEDFDMVDAQLHADSPPNSAVTERTFVSEDEPAIKAEPISAGRVPPPNTSPPFDGRTIVILGTASRTWEALLYWLYTGTIVFAPLASAGPAARAAAVAAHTTANPDRPAPVSCKAVYRLADAVRTFLPVRRPARRALTRCVRRSCASRPSSGARSTTSRRSSRCRRTCTSCSARSRPGTTRCAGSRCSRSSSTGTRSGALPRSRRRWSTSRADACRTRAMSLRTSSCARPSATRAKMPPASDARVTADGPGCCLVHG